MTNAVRVFTIYIIGITFLLCGESHLKPVFEYNPEGGMLVTGYLGKNNSEEYTVKQGLWVMYYSDGKIGLEKQYSNGVENGSYRTFYENGLIENEGAYKNGLLNGDFIVRYPTGEIKSRGNYSDGKKNGPWVERYVSGALSRSGIYKLGALDGVVTVWKGQGGIEVKMLDSAGTGILREWHDNGSMKSEANYLNGFLDGPAKTYHQSESEKLESKTVYSNGIEVGPRQFFDEKGNLIKECFPGKL